MLANKGYHGGAPTLDRLLITPYSSVRSAWADLLRGEVDMLYEVGVDAVDLLQPSRDVRVLTFERHYASMVLLNLQRPQLRDPGFRRTLNAAVNRQELVENGLNGRGSPAVGAVWPHHWAYNSAMPEFRYQPHPAQSPARFSLLYTEPSHERLALLLQRQLQAVGIQVTLETAPIEVALGRAREGDFDAFLIDAVHGPTLVRPSWFWASDGPYNWGRYSSPAVDTALDSIRHAPDDAAYKAGVAAFQKAIVDDPPAIFLAWGERARAVSTRFELPPVEPGVDILPTLRLWRPATDKKRVSPN
jgi:ABC-type transport system substrate-binding protein